MLGPRWLNTESDKYIVRTSDRGGTVFVKGKLRGGSRTWCTSVLYIVAKLNQAPPPAPPPKLGQNLLMDLLLSLPSDGFFGRDFVYTTSAHRDTSIAHVFDDFGSPETPNTPI